LYNASRHVRNAPWPNRGRSATALNTKSLLHAIIGRWSPTLEEFDVIFGFPCVKRKSVIICNDVSQWIGSPRSTTAKIINNYINNIKSSKQWIDLQLDGNLYYEQDLVFWLIHSIKIKQQFIKEKKTLK
jgi:hypothetical protein